MDTAIIIRIGLVITGLTIVILTFLLHSAKKLTVNLAVIWEMIGIGLILVGAIPGLSGWCSYLSYGTMIAMLFVGALTVWGGYELSALISSLAMKNQELAMQVSLLNQENERILSELSELTGKSRREL